MDPGGAGLRSREGRGQATDPGGAGLRSREGRGQAMDPGGAGDGGVVNPPFRATSGSRP